MKMERTSYSRETCSPPDGAQLRIDSSIIPQSITLSSLARSIGWETIRSTFPRARFTICVATFAEDTKYEATRRSKSDRRESGCKALRCFTLAVCQRLDLG